MDAPLSRPMVRDEFEAYMEAEYGRHGMLDLQARMQRALTHGTSSRVGTKDGLLTLNRAGPKESHLATWDEIVWSALKWGKQT